MNDSSKPAVPAARIVRFGDFEVDIQRRELRRLGVRVNLQRKPFQVLELLLQNAGMLVTRAELREHLWPDLHVSYDRSLNTAVNVLRHALGDVSRRCQYIETRPGIGYRFIARVEQIGDPVIERHSGTSKKNYVANVDAYQDYLKGRYFFNKMTEEDLRKSMAHFEAALCQDPAHSPARAGLADIYTLFAFWGVLPPFEAHQRAKHAATTALEHDDELAEAQASLAKVEQSFDWNWHGAEARYKKALQLDRNYADGHRSYAALLLATGRTEEALSEIRTAQQLDPLSLITNMELAWSFYGARDFRAAIDQCWKTLVLEPRFAPAQHTLGLAYEQLAMSDEALTELHNARVCSGGGQPAMMAALGHAYAASGMKADASEVLRELDRLSKRRYVSPYWRALIHSGLGAYDLAFECLKDACNQRDVSLMWLKVDPRFDPLRSDQRFDRLLKTVHPGPRSSTGSFSACA